MTDRETRASGPLPLTASTPTESLAMQRIDAAAPRDGCVYVVADKGCTIHASAYYADGKWWWHMTNQPGTAPEAQPLGFTPYQYHPRHDGGPTTGA